MEPKVIQQWIEILRDVLIVAVGTFMLVFETVFVHVPNYLLVGAGLALLGVPPALRYDQIRRIRNALDDE